MAWIVSYSKKAEKQYLKLPQAMQDRIDFLTAEIENMGPIRGNWKNYSKTRRSGMRNYYCFHHFNQGFAYQLCLF